MRGYRIELGEIESRIKEAEAVGNCVVVLREDRPGDQRLTAYYVPRDGQAVSVFEVRRHLQSKLPEYMVPQHYVELSSIPLTPNGKVDRKALPKPERDGATEQGYVAPRTETERKIAAVWQEVLSRERVGLQDDFFELGGHSLLATQVMSRVNRLFNVQMPLRRLFEARTVGGLAEHIASETQEEEESPISRISREGALVCFIFAGAAVVFIAAGAGEYSLSHKRGCSSRGAASGGPVGAKPQRRSFVAMRPCEPPSRRSRAGRCR